MELWSLPSGTLRHTLPSPGSVGDFAFSPDGQLIALGEIGRGAGRYVRHVYIYDTTTGRRRYTHEAARSASARCSR